MNKEQYATTQLVLVQFAAEMRGLDLDGFIEWIDRAETIAPFMDPTLYLKNRAAGDPLAKMRAIAVGARQMRDAMPEECGECGCTNARACERGCSWLAPGLCSSCAPALVAR